MHRTRRQNRPCVTARSHAWLPDSRVRRGPDAYAPSLLIVRVRLPDIEFTRPNTLVFPVSK